MTKMRIKTADWDGSVFGSLVEETDVHAVALRAMPFEPAEMTVKLIDPDGTLFQQYDGYAAVGKIEFEYPYSTYLFRGRIIKARHNTREGETLLYCRDWLDQCDDERIIYDMREPLDGVNLRESVLRSDPDQATGIVLPIWTIITDYYLYDDNAALGSWGWVDDFNGMYVVFPGSMAGPHTVRMGPHDETVSVVLDDDTPAYGQSACWATDSFGSPHVGTSTYHMMNDDTNLWAVDYEFYLVGTTSDYIEKIKSVKMHAHLYAYNATVLTYDAKFEVLFWDDDGNAWIKLGDITPTSETSDKWQFLDWEIPVEYMDKIVNSTTGVFIVRFYVTGNDSPVWRLSMDWLEAEVEYLNKAASVALEILDTETNRLKVDTDCSMTGLKLHEGTPYSICRPVFEHIASDETPGGLVDDGCQQVTLTATDSIEHTTGISLAHYREFTRRGILKDIAITDQALFWVELGTTVFTYKATFAEGSPIALDDSDVLDWINAEYDGEVLSNEAHVYGIRVGDEQIYTNSADLAPDPGADSKTAYGITKSQFYSGAGVISEYLSEETAKALVDRDQDVLFHLGAVLDGCNTTYKLGTEVLVTSTPLGLAAEAYVVVRWDWNSETDMTQIALHPRSSVGLQPHFIGFDVLYKTQQQVDNIRQSIYNPPPAGVEW